MDLGWGAWTVAKLLRWINWLIEWNVHFGSSSLRSESYWIREVFLPKMSAKWSEIERQVAGFQLPSLASKTTAVGAPRQNSTQERDASQGKGAATQLAPPKEKTKQEPMVIGRKVEKEREVSLNSIRHQEGDGRNTGAKYQKQTDDGMASSWGKTEKDQKKARNQKKCRGRKKRGRGDTSGVKATQEAARPEKEHKDIKNTWYSTTPQLQTAPRRLRRSQAGGGEVKRKIPPKKGETKQPTEPTIKVLAEVGRTRPNKVGPATP